MNADLFGGIYSGKKVLVTGHTGFKGSWLAAWLQRLGAVVTGYALKPSTDPNHFDLLGLEMDSVIGDVRDLALLQKTVDRVNPDIVFHLAAQPLVRLSYRQPVETFQTNIAGTLHVCEACRKNHAVRALVAITTDKVYENNEWEWGYREVDRLGGHDPYSASKAGAEIVLSSYRSSFFAPDESRGFLLTSVRAGNVIGGGDWSLDRLIPDIMKATSRGETVEIRNPAATRPWQHVLECLSGYLSVGQRLLEGRKEFATAFNFGPGPEGALSVGEVAKKVKQWWPAMRFETPPQKGAPHEARFLQLDCARAFSMLGWRPTWDLDDALKTTVEWYKDFYTQGKARTGDDIAQFVRAARKKDAVWTRKTT